MMYCCVMYLSCQFSSSWLVFVVGLGIDCSIRTFDCEGISDGKRDMPGLLKYDGVSCYMLPALCDLIFLGPNLDSGVVSDSKRRQIVTFQHILHVYYHFLLQCLEVDGSSFASGSSLRVFGSGGFSKNIQLEP